MNPWLVLGAIAGVGTLFVVLPVAAAAFSRFRCRWRVECPEDGLEAQIRVDPVAAARGEVLGRADLAVIRCSSWPERQGCAQPCLGLPVARWRRPRPGELPPPGPDRDQRPTILVPLDGTPGSESALLAAAGVARACQGRLRLLRVSTPMPAVCVDDRTIAFADQEMSRVELEDLAYLRGLTPCLAGVEVDHAVRFGDPGTEIVKDAEDSHADLIAMARRRRRGVRRAFRRSVTGRVGRHAEVPVLLVPHGGTP